MIPRSQHFGDRAPFPFDGPGIVRILEKALFEAFLGTAGRRAHYAGKQANASVENGQSGGLSAREHDVAERHFLDRPALENPLVEPLEPAAQDGNAGAGREVADAGLGDRLSAGGHGEHRAIGLQCPCMIDASRQHIGLEHHPGAAPGRRIVHRAVLVGGEVADLDGVERPGALPERAARQADAERPGKHLGIEREDGGGESHSKIVVVGTTKRSSLRVAKYEIGKPTTTTGISDMALTPINSMRPNPCSIIATTISMPTATSDPLTPATRIRVGRPSPPAQTPPS